MLAQKQQGEACKALIRDVLDHSGIYVFGELLDCPSVQALDSTPDGHKLVNLLRIFAYGTYPDYKMKRDDLPELTPAQLRKLQLLTVVSLATKAKHIKFSTLEDALDISDTRELQDLIIKGVYQNLIVGKMDQLNQCLLVESCACRDCRDEDIDYIIETLSSWHSSAQSMLNSLDDMVKHSHDSFEKHKASREELDKLIQSTRDSIKEGDAGGKPGGESGGGCTRMPVDDADEESKRAKSTRGRWMGAAGTSLYGKY